MHFPLATLLCVAGSASAALVATKNETDSSSPYKNVFGRPLAKCSGAGMALTGFTREGTCTARARADAVDAVERR